MDPTEEMYKAREERDEARADAEKAWEHVEALAAALKPFLHACDFIRKADMLNPKISDPPECGKRALLVEYRYEGEESWRCGRHKTFYHKEDKQQVAARAALDALPQPSKVETNG